MKNKLKTKLFNIFRIIFKIPFLEKWLRKKTQGKPISNFWCKLAPNKYQYPSKSFRVFNYNNIILKADIHDYIGHYLYFGFKDEGHDKLLQLIHERDIVLDIGTNIGSTLLQIAHKTGKNGKVFGFEPDPLNFKSALENISLNNFKNIQIENMGLGNEPGEFKLFVDVESNRGGNRIKLNHEKETNNYTTIKVERLDDWLHQQNLQQLDVIKIDVEGFETNVIKGGMKTIKKHRPKLFIEVDDTNLKAVNSSAKELIQLLEKENYLLTSAQTGAVVSSTNNFENCHFDVIAIPKLN